MDLQPCSFADRSIYLLRMGNPNDWTGDWRRKGKYLRGKQQQISQERLLEHESMLVGLSVRLMGSKKIAAVLSVSREAIDRRLRPLGLKAAEPGQVGRPKRSQTAA